jgi:hypothetical protein
MTQEYVTEIGRPVANHPLTTLMSGTAISSDGKVARYAERINENWRKTVEGVLEVGVERVY